MRASLTLGRIAGIEIGLNWSLAIAFFLFAASLAGDVFPSDVPGYAATSYFIASVLAVALFYASLLAHELGHALVARQLGTRVDGITLWLFGGVARLSGDVLSGSAELRITLVGPAITIAVGIFFAVISAGLGTFNLFPLTADMFAWLARINLILAIFNLIPAFPLDGGRVLRALLWRVTHDQIRATSIAAWLGRAFGVVMILGGLYVAFLGDSLINGLWFGVLGYFLFVAAGSQELQTRVHRSLAGVRVRDVMTPNPIAAPDWITVDDFATRFAAAYRATSYLVRDVNGRPTGIVSLEDAGRVPASHRASTQLRAIVRPLGPGSTAYPDDLIEAVLQRMDDGDRGAIVVMEGDRLVGIVTPADIRRSIDMANLRGTGSVTGLSTTS